MFHIILKCINVNLKKRKQKTSTISGTHTYHTFSNNTGLAHIHNKHTQTHKHTNTQTHKHTNTQIHKHTNNTNTQTTQTHKQHKHTNTQIQTKKPRRRLVPNRLEPVYSNQVGQFCAGRKNHAMCLRVHSLKACRHFPNPHLLTLTTLFRFSACYFDRATPPTTTQKPPVDSKRRTIFFEI